MTRLTFGSGVIWNKELWQLIDIPEINRALIKNQQSGRVELVDATELNSSSPNHARAAPGLTAISKQDWDTAYEKFSALTPLLRKGKRQRTYQEIDEVAKQFGTSRVTIYRWLQKMDGDVLGFFLLFHCVNCLK